MRRRGVAVSVAVASSMDLVSPQDTSGFEGNSHGNLSVLSSTNTRSGGYVTAGRLDALRESLSDRDRAILRDVARLRLVTSNQLERLHFAGLAEMSRPVVRRRVLGRLTRLRLLATMERRIGGVRAGSEGNVYYLDVAGQRLCDTTRRGSLPSERYVRHVLAVSQLYVDLAQLAREGRLRLHGFEAEPASWWPDGRGGHMKPDAHVLVANDTYRDHWWVEVDLSTEHVPALKRKLRAYREFWQSGQLGPGNIMPRILVTVPDTGRYSEVVRLIRQLPSDVEKLFIVAVANDAAAVIMRCLNESD